MSGIYERCSLVSLMDGGRWIGCGKGWYPLLTEANRKLAELFPNYEIHQVKEKYGTLRFYWGTGKDPWQIENPEPVREKDHTDEEWKEYLDGCRKNREAHEEWYKTPEGKAYSEEAKRRYELAEKIEREAEAKSAYTCEKCGKTGRSTGGYWIQTLCLEHVKEKGAPFSRQYMEVRSWDITKLNSAADAEELIALIKEKDEANTRKESQIIGIHLWEKDSFDKTYELGDEFIETLVPYIATRNSPQATEWGADPKTTVDFSRLTEDSYLRLGEVLKKYDLRDAYQEDLARVDKIREELKEQQEARANEKE